MMLFDKMYGIPPLRVEESESNWFLHLGMAMKKEHGPVRTGPCSLLLQLGYKYQLGTLRLYGLVLPVSVPLKNPEVMRF